MSRRDISDLKARLGLKKKGTAEGKTSGPAGVVPPPGVRSQPSAIPAPPGAAPPAPVIPSASDDPFAAMNAMAAVGVAQQHAKGPEIVVVNDGGPVEKVDQKSRAIGIAKYVGIVLVPLVFGVVIGQISNSAKIVNKTIDDAALLRDDIKRIRTQFNNNVLNQLLLAKERGAGGNAFKINDGELTEALNQADILPEIDSEAAFRSHMYELDPTLVKDILTFYSKAIALSGSVEQHAKMAANNAKAIKDGEKKREGAKPDPKVNAYLQGSPYSYGVFVGVPTKKEKDVQFGARLVEIGPPVCADRKPSETGQCPPPGPIGFGYRERAATGDGWKLMELGNPGADENVAAKKLLPLVPTGTMEELLKGSDAAVSEVAYLRSVGELFNQASQLIELGVYIEGKLDSKSKEGKSFTFFL